MKKMLLLAGVLAVGIHGPASAQNAPVVVTTPGVTVTTGQNGTSVVTPNTTISGTTVVTTDETAPATSGKSVRRMSDAERKAFWDNLPEEQKMRIIERRQQAEAARKNPWRDPKTLKTVSPTGSATSGTTQTQTGQNAELSASMARGKAAWDAMSDDEKRAFVQQNQDAIRAAVQARQGGTAVQP